MNLSKREKVLAWGVGGVLGLLALDYVILTPFLAQRNAVEDMRVKDLEEIREARDLRRQEREKIATWKDRRTQGLSSDPQSAERQLLGAVKDWAAETNLTLASVKPEHIESKKELREFQVQAAGSGNHEAIVKFLYKLQTAQFPVRVTEVQVSSRADSQDLALQVRISTLYLVDDAKVKGKDAKKAAASERGARNDDQGARVGQARAAVGTPRS